MNDATMVEVRNRPAMRIILRQEGKYYLGRYGMEQYYLGSAPALIHRDNSEFLGTLFPNDTVHFLSRTSVVSAGQQYLPSMSNLYRAASSSFNKHYPLSLSPEVLWYAIIHEIAYTVKSNPDRYAFVFTSTPESRQTISVRDDSLVFGSNQNNWGRTIGLFKNALERKIHPELVKLFCPLFSGSTAEDRVAILVAFMETVSSYYKFEVHTMCGIPEVVLEGALEDWKLLVSGIDGLSELFKDELSGYFSILRSVFARIVSTLESNTADVEFWNSLYNVRSESGSVTMSGWLTTLLAYKNTRNGRVLRDFSAGKNTFGQPLRVDEIPSHISSVPFIWKYFSQQISMRFLSGILGVDVIDDTTLRPRLGFGISELKNP